MKIKNTRSPSTLLLALMLGLLGWGSSSMSMESAALAQQPASAQAAHSGEASQPTLTIVIGGVRSARGTIRVALFDVEAQFPNGARPAATLTLRARSGQLRGVVRGLAPGRYAIAAYHDEDGNAELNTNLFGVPSEGVGFGNDVEAGTFGPPSFESARVAFGVASGRTSFRMRY